MLGVMFELDDRSHRGEGGREQSVRDYALTIPRKFGHWHGHEVN